MEAVAAGGWYVDPHDASQWRWWDGSQWTEHTAMMRPAGEQTFAESQVAATLPAAAAADVVSTRWPLPAADAPLVPRDNYSKQAHASIAKAFDKAMLAHLHVLVFVGLASVVVSAIGLVFLRLGFGGDVLLHGTQMWRRRVQEIRVDSRGEPWATAFRKRGLLAPGGLPGRCPSMPILAGGAVDDIWAVRDQVRGFDVTCGELVAVNDVQGELERWRFLTFAAFEIPPAAAARHREVSVRQKRFGAIGGRGRQIHLESIAVDNALTIRVNEGTDDVTARELFGPQLVAALADHPVSWDQRGQWLLVFQESPKEPIVEFDAFLETAAAVARAYWMDQE